MRAVVPVTGFTGFRREMDRLFDRFFEGEPVLGEWMPRVDITENHDKVIVKAEVPGIDVKDIEVSVNDEILTIRGEKKHDKEEKDEHSYRVERSYGAFCRTLALPTPVDASKAEASFKNGVVTITLAKSARAKGTTIPVKAAA